jgi:cation diffusion facilitator CzcD-associated flavoprotein CzcO
MTSKTVSKCPWSSRSSSSANVTNEDQHTEEDKEKWTKDRNAYLDFRGAAEDALNAPYEFIINGTEMQMQSKELFAEKMKERLTKNPEVFESLKPDFDPACRRLTPGPGYLNAVVQDNVNLINKPIERVVENGIVCNGQVREVDAIICATGFDV